VVNWPREGGLGGGSVRKKIKGTDGNDFLKRKKELKGKNGGGGKIGNHLV